MRMYQTLYNVYTYQYTWKVTVKDFILSKIAGLQLTTLLKNVLFDKHFSRTLQFLRNSFVRKFFEWLLLKAMTNTVT